MRTSRIHSVLRDRSNAFTLVELLVAITVIGVLTAILLPAVNAAREAARRISCTNKQRQVGVAITNYETSFRKFPAGRIGCDDTGDLMTHRICPPGLSPEQKTGASGFVVILPQLEENGLYDQVDVYHGGLWNRNVDDLYWYANKQKCRAIKQRIDILVCASDPSDPISNVYAPVTAATSSYAFVNGSLGPDAPVQQTKFENNGMFLYVTSRRFKQIRDGLSRTMMLGEVVMSDTWESSNTWSYTLVNADCLRSTRNPLNTRPGAGITLERQNGAFGSFHAGGANFCFGDGHVQFITEDIELELYQALSTIDGREGTRSTAANTELNGYKPDKY